MRSSIANRLGLDAGGLPAPDRNVDGVVEMTLDATRNYTAPLTEERLFSWHAALFPTGRSRMRRIRVGQWRDDADGPMEVVSGPIGRQRVHYTAPPAECLGDEVSRFLEWFQDTRSMEPVLAAGVAHLWFVTIHPFEDGNGRLARAIADMALARSEESPERFYSMSAQIRVERKASPLKDLALRGLRTARFTQPGAFNDPFEMVPELYVPDSFGADKDIQLSFSVTAPRRAPGVHELDADFESDQCSDRNSRSIRASLDQTIGILCLSGNPSSLLMWSYYADAYAGAVVEFDQSHDFFRDNFQVEYRERRPKKDIRYYVSSDEPIPIAELCVKPKVWEHEAEVRVVRNLSDCRLVAETYTKPQEYPVYVMDIPAECIKSVTMGERMTVDNQRRVWEMVKDRDISLYLDAISNWGYDFRKEPIRIAGMKNPILSPRTAHIFSQQKGTIGDLARWQLNSNELAQVVNDTL